MRSAINYIIGLLALATICIISCTSPNPEYAESPGKDILPITVVNSQLHAFAISNQSKKSSSFAAAYAFSSANFRKQYDLEAFQKLLGKTDYEILTDIETFEVSEHFVDANEAQFFVFVQSREGAQAEYIFELTKSYHYTNCKQCWLTEAIIRIKPQPGNKRKKSRDKTLTV